MTEIQKLISIAKDWNRDFKAYLLEDVADTYQSLSKFINDMLYAMSDMTERDEEKIDTYQKYKTRFLSLNLAKLDEEYKVIKDFLSW